MRDFFIAVRNLGRNTRRTVLTLLTIAAGLTSLMILGGYYEYNFWGLRESFIRSQLGHLQIYPQGYLAARDSDPYHASLPDLLELQEFLGGLNEVQVASPRLLFWGVADTGQGENALVEVRGVVPEAENLINTFFTFKAGRDLTSGEALGAEFGRTLAENLKLEPGQDFFLTVVDPQGQQNSMMLQTRSIMGSFSQEFDARVLRVPLNTAQDLTGFPGAQEFVVLLNDDTTQAAVRDKIKAESLRRGWDLEVTQWQDHAGYYLQVVEFYGGYFRIMLFIVAVVSFFSTFNALLMAFFERITEVGTLRSFGAPGSAIARMMVWEGLVLGVIGTLGAMVLAVLLSLGIERMGGIPMPPPPGITTPVNVMILLTPGLFGLSALIGLTVPLLASVIPIVKTLKMHILDQIRFNER